MSQSGIRFRPPQVPTSPELQWVFLRAFGPTQSSFSNSFSPQRAVELARQFEISSRIAARQGHRRLEAELGEEWSSQLLQDRQQSVILGLQRVAAVRNIARTAVRLRIPLVFLKFIALHFSGRLQPGSREAADIDVLVPEGAERELHEALRREGYVGRDLWPSEHHLPTLDHPVYGPLEVHRFIPGVAVEGSVSLATVSQLVKARLLSPVPSLPGDCLLPHPEVLTAHILVHGIVQHGNHPDAYSAARMLADLLDLGIAEDQNDQALAAATGMIKALVPPEEAKAVRELCRSLVRGEPLVSAGPSSSSPENLLLRHILAGVLNKDYRNSLNLRFFSRGLADRRPELVFGKSLKRAFFPSPGELERIYGTRAGTAGYYARRLLRPLALVGRLVRYSLSFIKVRGSGPR